MSKSDDAKRRLAILKLGEAVELLDSLEDTRRTDARVAVALAELAIALASGVPTPVDDLPTPPAGNAP